MPVAPNDLDVSPISFNYETPTEWKRVQLKSPMKIESRSKVDENGLTSFETPTLRCTPKPGDYTGLQANIAISPTANTTTLYDSIQNECNMYEQIKNRLRKISSPKE